MTRLPLKHVVFIAGPGPTHVRPAINTCVRLAVRFPNLFVSVYTLASFQSQGVKYLATCSESASKRIRIVASTFSTPTTGLLDVLAAMDSSFGPWIAQELTSLCTNINGLLVDRPSYIIEDHLNGGVALVNQQYHNLPVASWWAAGAASFLGHFGNEQHGGGWRTIEAIGSALENQESDDPEKDLDNILSREITNRVVRIPGLPLHYEHEQIPQKAPGTLSMFVPLYKRWLALSKQTTMVVFSSVYEMESAVAEACHDALTKPLTGFFVGFAIDPPHRVPHFDPSTTDVALSFVNRAYNELGPHSVVYVGFGTSWFPSSGSHLRILIEEILAQGLRLVFSVKAEKLKAVGINKDFTDKIVKSGQAIFPEWVTQPEILANPATHYFVSHGGWNSTTEAIMCEVPLIFWPILGDQPTNAMQFARQLDCGFELLQVRTGVAQSVVYDPSGDIPIIGSDQAVRDEIRRVLIASKQYHGARQRSNIRLLAEAARGAMEAGGSGDLALESFGKAIGL